MAKAQNAGFFKSKKISILISFVIAVVFWFAISIIENPESTRVLNGVQLYLDTTGTIVAEQGLSIINEQKDAQSVSVKISGASYVVNSISPDDILVTPSFEDINAAGNYSVKLNATNNSTKNFTIESVTPETIDIELDYMDTVSYDVQIKVKGAQAADGLILGAERFTNSQSASLEVVGPRSIVSTISTVYAEVKADESQKLSATKSYDADVVLYDKNGKKVKTDKLQLSFDIISVSVPVYKTKTVPIRCTYTNKPIDFTPVATVSVNGKEVNEINIEGTPDIIDKTDFVELESIDIYTVNKKNNEFSKAFVLPSGVSTVDEVTEIKVNLDTTNIKQKKFKVSNAIAINNDNNYKVKLAQPINVIVCGEASVINQLAATNLYAEIDLDGKTIGEQSVTVKVKSKLKDNVWQYGTYEAKISVTE